MVPSTTRRTPPASSWRTSSSVRTPPPDWTGTGTAAAMASTVGRLTGTPPRGRVEVDHVQPPGTGVDEPAGQHHGVPVVGLAVEIPLDEADGTTVADVDGRVEVHHAGRSATART